MIVTGGSSGIGVETARALVGAGADVTLAVRNVEAGSEAAADIVDSTSMENIRVARLDLADRASIAAFVAAWEGPLDVLINNAGVMAMPEEHTAEGWEMQFATNHLGHFALSVGLHDALAAAAPARIVSVSSSAHFSSPVIFDDLHFAFRRYDPWLAYGQSKTANVLFAVGATKRWAGGRDHRQRPHAGRDRHEPPAPRRRHGELQHEPRPGQERPRKALPPPCCSPPRRSSTVSAAATS